MVGLGFLLVLLIWALIAGLISGYIASVINNKAGWRLPVIVVFPFIFISPLIDEVIAIPQVNGICEEGARLIINEAAAKGKVVRVDVDPDREEIKGLIVPVSYSHFSYKIVDTSEEVASFNIYHVSGGILSRTINFNSSHSPWLINTSRCRPEGYGSISKKYDFTVIN